MGRGNDASCCAPPCSLLRFSLAQAPPPSLQLPSLAQNRRLAPSLRSLAELPTWFKLRAKETLLQAPPPPTTAFLH